MKSNNIISKIKRASVLPGENKYLQELVISKWSNQSYNRYSKWLIRNNDERGYVLRELAESLKDLRNTKLPKSSKYPKAWRDLVGITVAKGITDKSFDYFDFDVVELQKPLFELCEPSLTIKPTLQKDNVFRIGDTKFGGLPHLTNECSWPKYKGKLMGFIGQLNMSDFQDTIISHKLPKKGLLSFFLYYDAWEGDIPALRNHKSAFKVFYTKNIGKLKVTQEPDGLIEGNEISPTCKLSFSEGLDMPEAQYDDGLSRFTKKLVSKYGDDDLNTIVDVLAYNLNETNKWPSRLFGCAHNGAGSAPTLKNEDNFLTLRSEEKLKWCWLDGYHLHYSLKSYYNLDELASKFRVDIC